ncbi:MAG: protease complex subunit PrcB family protein [Lachnospiraceae bacterium]|nr:protease complex subunit PrcB family protein [Lachnospiraceae bacterium]
MKKKGLFLLIVLGCAAFLQGCNLFEEEEKLRDVDYTVVCPEDVPQELGDEITNVKGKEFQLSYDDGEYLYIARGYGSRNTSGYNISVKDMYITEHTLVLDTEITGPREGEDVVDKKTTPYIVVKTEPMEKQIVFR